MRANRPGPSARARFTYPRESRNPLHAVFAQYLRGNHVWYIYGNILRYTVNTGDSVPFLVVGGRRAVVSSSFVCGALAFLFILSFSLRALSSRLVRAPSAAVFIAMDHGCAHTDKCEMLLKISSRFHDDVTLF